MKKYTAGYVIKNYRNSAGVGVDCHCPYRAQTQFY